MLRLHAHALCLVLALAGALVGAGSGWPVSPQNNAAPRFSWDTMGGMVFMQVCNPNATLASPGYPASALRTLARYPLVTFEKCVGTMTPGYEEDKVIRSCTALKNINPNM